MQSAIVGLPFVGKTTLFNLLTGAHAATGTFAGAEAAANVGVAKVPDERLDKIAPLYRPKKVTHAEVRYTDLGLARGAGRGEGIAGRHLAEMREADALVHVVRAFRDPAVPHVEGGVDPARDASTLEVELLVADVAHIERRLERLEPEVRGARHGPEREEKEREHALLSRVRDGLGAGTAVRDLPLDRDERRLLRGFRLLTEKPELVVVNLDEADLQRADEVARAVRGAFAHDEHVRVIPASVKIEAEIAELSPEEASAFRQELGLADGPLERVVRETYALLGLISFFTGNAEEARAWTVPAGTTAVEAAGTIHSDMGRSFIRAEVIRWDELLSYGGLPEARAKGALRVEGKEYSISDGEVVHVLFHVGPR